MNNRRYTKDDIAGMREMRRKGATYREIAEKYGRTEVAIVTWFLHNKEQEEDKDKDKEETPRREKNLKDFTPREMIKHLYDLGYRIEGGSLYLVKKTQVKLEDICG